MDTESNLQKILVADDCTPSADAVAALVRRQFKCPVDIVYDGDGVLAALGQARYNLLITDMLMPGCSGVPLIQKVTAEWSDMDILVTTAYPDEFPYVDVIAAGAADFIVKPYPAAELEAKILRIRSARPAPTAEDAPQRPGLPGHARGDGTSGRHRHVFEFSMNGMVILEQEGYQIRDVNRAFCSFVGKERDALLGTCLFELFEAGSHDRVALAFELFETAGQGSLGGVWLDRTDGKAVCLDVSASFIPFGSERLVEILCKDVTEQHKVQERLAEYAQTDPLTGLFNQRLLNLHLEKAVAQAKQGGRPTSLLFIDLDNFKQCNDTHGHQVGDAVLKVVAELIHKHTRGASDEGFRYGGDEFAVLLGEAGAEIGVLVAERLREDFMSREQYGTSMSIGIALYQDDMTPEDFVKAADSALYASKLAGRNRSSVA